MDSDFTFFVCVFHKIGDKCQSPPLPPPRPTPFPHFLRNSAQYSLFFHLVCFVLCFFVLFDGKGRVLRGGVDENYSAIDHFGLEENYYDVQLE